VTLGYERTIIATPVPGGQVLRMDLGDGKVEQGSYDTGWLAVDRPRRRQGLEWVGHKARTLTTPVRFDRFKKGGRSVELECRAIDNAVDRWLMLEGPPTYRLAGPIPWTHLTWVVAAVEWGDYLRRDSDGERVRQDLRITWLEFESLDVVLSPAKRAQEAIAAAKPPTAAGTPAPAGGAAPRVYTVVRGDTLSKIAASQLGNHARWGEIASLNGLRDPNRIAVGQRLKLP
jgi:hypothetical protein